MVGYHHGKINVLTYNNQFSTMTCCQMIVNWLLSSVSKNVPLFWDFISNKVKHIKKGMRMQNMMKCFMSEVKRVAIQKICWKARMKYCYYMSAIRVWDNVHNYINIKWIANNQNNVMVNSLQSHAIFKYISESKECTLKIKIKIHY